MSNCTISETLAALGRVVRPLAPGEAGELEPSGLEIARAAELAGAPPINPFELRHTTGNEWRIPGSERGLIARTTNERRIHPLGGTADPSGYGAFRLLTLTLRDRASDDGREITAVDLEDARRQAHAYAEEGTYDTSDGTVWVDVEILDEDGDELETVTVTIDPDEPPCSAEEHDWQSPHSLVGGLVENPGVRGNGGGIVSIEVCMCCGCARTTDTWAHRPDTGEQGLVAVSYEPGRFTDEVKALVE